MKTKARDISYEIVFSICARALAGLTLLRFMFRMSNYDASVWLFEKLFGIIDFSIIGGIQFIFLSVGFEVSQFVAELVLMYLFCIGFMARSIGYSKRVHLIAPQRQLDEPIPKPSQIKERVYARKPISRLNTLVLSVFWPFTIVSSFLAKKPNTRKVVSWFRGNFISEVIQAIFAGMALGLIYLFLKGVDLLIFFLIP